MSAGIRFESQGVGYPFQTSWDLENPAQSPSFAEEEMRPFPRLTKWVSALWHRRDDQNGIQSAGVGLLLPLATLYLATRSGRREEQKIALDDGRTLILIRDERKNTFTLSVETPEGGTPQLIKGKKEATPIGGEKWTFTPSDGLTVEVILPKNCRGLSEGNITINGQSLGHPIPPPPAEEKSKPAPPPPPNPPKAPPPPPPISTLTRKHISPLEAFLNRAPIEVIRPSRELLAQKPEWDFQLVHHEPVEDRGSSSMLSFQGHGITVDMLSSPGRKIPLPLNVDMGYWPFFASPIGIYEKHLIFATRTGLLFAFDPKKERLALLVDPLLPKALTGNLSSTDLETLPAEKNQALKCHLAQVFKSESEQVVMGVRQEYSGSRTPSREEITNDPLLALKNSIRHTAVILEGIRSRWTFEEEAALPPLLQAVFQRWREFQMKMACAANHPGMDTSETSSEELIEATSKFRTSHAPLCPPDPSMGNIPQEIPIALRAILETPSSFAFQKSPPLAPDAKLLLENGEWAFRFMVHGPKSGSPHVWVRMDPEGKMSEAAGLVGPASMGKQISAEVHTMGGRPVLVFGPPLTGIAYALESRSGKPHLIEVTPPVLRGPVTDGVIDAEALRLLSPQWTAYVKGCWTEMIATAIVAKRAQLPTTVTGHSHFEQTLDPRTLKEWIGQEGPTAVFEAILNPGMKAILRNEDGTFEIRNLETRSDTTLHAEILPGASAIGKPCAKGSLIDDLLLSHPTTQGSIGHSLGMLGVIGLKGAWTLNQGGKLNIETFVSFFGQSLIGLGEFMVLDKVAAFGLGKFLPKAAVSLLAPMLSAGVLAFKDPEVIKELKEKQTGAAIYRIAQHAVVGGLGFALGMRAGHTGAAKFLTGEGYALLKGLGIGALSTLGGEAVVAIGDPLATAIGQHVFHKASPTGPAYTPRGSTGWPPAIFGGVPLAT